MIDILFSDSACGSLKMAQHYGEGEYSNICLGVIVTHHDGSSPTEEEIEAARQEIEERERLRWKKAKPLGGDPADVYGFSLALSVGDILEDIPSVRRQKVLDWLYSIFPDDKEIGDSLGEELLGNANEVLNTILGRAASGESLRLWYSNQPDDICGMYWFMTQLTKQERYGEIFVVQLPEWETDGSGDITAKTGWGEVSSEEWHRYLTMQELVPASFVQSCAMQWKALQKENAPLRAVLNGQLVSVRETLYDDFIAREILMENEEFNEANIIGRVIGKYKLGIGDAWVAMRIEEMICNGLLKPVSEAPKGSPIYHRILRKCDKS